MCAQPLEIYVDKESKLTLHGLQQYYLKLTKDEKNRKLTELLDALEFNQVVIFVSKVVRARELDKLLKECNFPSIAIHTDMSQEDRCVEPAAAACCAAASLSHARLRRVQHQPVQVVQGVQGAHPRRNRPLWPRHRH